MKLRQCKSCKANIYWLPTEKGKTMPTDADSLTEDEKRWIESNRELLFKFGKHTSHFATCPNARKHRKK